MNKYAIIGGGLAGLNLAVSLLERDVPADRITVVDAETAERGSAAPGALLHPFPGRKAAPKNENFRVFRAARRFVEWVDETLDDPSIVEGVPVARPLRDDDLGESLHTSWETHRDSYPDWLRNDVGPGTRFPELDAGLERFDRVLVYEPGYVVHLDKLCRHLGEYLETEGIHRIDAEVTGLEAADGDWHVDGPDAPVSADRVVLAMGFGLHPWFPDLATSGRGGELWVATPPSGGSLGCIVNASGHVGPRGDGRWVAGSTWWSPDERTPAQSPDQAHRALLERCAPLVPALHDAEVHRIWGGVRCNFGDHQPLVGPIPGQSDLYVLGALGSKGLFRAPYFAGRLADHLLDDASLPRLARSTRISAPKWRPASDVFHS